MLGRTAVERMFASVGSLAERREEIETFLAWLGKKNDRLLIARIGAQFVNT